MKILFRSFFFILLTILLSSCAWKEEDLFWKQKECSTVQLDKENLMLKYTLIPEEDLSLVRFDSFYSSDRNSCVVIVTLLSSVFPDNIDDSIVVDLFSGEQLYGFKGIKNKSTASEYLQQIADLGYMYYF